MYKVLLRPILFLFAPEFIHTTTFALLKVMSRVPGFRPLIKAVFTVEDPRLQRKILGLTFPNPVGLAAGFDKNGELTDLWSSFGFGFAEIGTVTPLAQSGNPRPRLFRLPLDKALINRMGFNNEGATTIAGRLARRRDLIVGGNIGKNKSTDNESAVQDYVRCVEVLRDHVDYFVVNVSSPNTPGLRELQDKEPLRQLLRAVKSKASEGPSPRPVLLKIAPDLTQGQLLDVVEVVKATRTDGVIATNTTLSREGLQTSEQIIGEIGAGGLSGLPLGRRSTEVIGFLRTQLGPSYVIIGVGGIMSPQDAIEKLRAGADLIQIYTGFVYEGPRFAKRIGQALLQAEANQG